MGQFRHYLDPSPTLEERQQEAFRALKIKPAQQEGIRALLAPLKAKDILTYEHSIRVGLLTWQIPRYMHLAVHPGFYSGTLHDVGKAMTDLKTLRNTGAWSAKDYKEIRHHVLDGFKLLRGKFDFTADIIVCHHLFQSNGYPKRPPPFLHDYSFGTQVSILFHARLLALADCYDALHRVNAKWDEKDELTGKGIKEKMISLNEDQAQLVKNLYTGRVFTTRLFGKLASASAAI
ncbi:MAG: HD domain-containing protein [bacterium]|nr:HD domain-containing protein [bacterium]